MHLFTYNLFNFN